jgi:hypothetical protein
MISYPESLLEVTILFTFVSYYSKPGKHLRFYKKLESFAVNLGTPKCKVSLHFFAFPYIIYIITV